MTEGHGVGPGDGPGVGHGDGPGVGPGYGPGVGPAYGAPGPSPSFISVDLPPPDPRAPGTPPRRSARSRLTEFAGSHRLFVEIGAVVVALLAGTGMGLALKGGGPGSPVASSAPVATNPVAPSPSPAAGAPIVAPADTLRFLRGQITSESGSTWDVVTPRGQTVTVALTPTTRFGTVASPSSAAQFAVGNAIAVRGTLSGSTITAVRIVVPRAPASPPTSVPTAQG